MTLLMLLVLLPQPLFIMWTSVLNFLVLILSWMTPIMEDL